MVTDPKRWGPPAWEFLYYIAFNYPNNPDKQKTKDMMDFIISFGKMIPCDKCRYHFQKQIKTDTLSNITKNRVTVVRWIMKIKNGISESKQDTYADLVKKYL
jgi:hypothetical protein